MTTDSSSPSSNTTQAPKDENALLVASGLLFAHARWILWWYPLLIAPDILYTFIDSVPDAVAAIAKRSIALIFLLFAARRVLTAAGGSTTGTRPAPASIALTLVIGLFFAALIRIPLGVGHISGPQIFLFALPGFLLSIYYFFYFLPLAAGTTHPLQIFQRARQVNLHEPLLALRVMITPYAIEIALSALISSMSPDGTSLGVRFAGSLVSGIGTALIPFVGGAYALTRISNSEWEQYGLDKYRQARLSTLALPGNQFFAGALKPANGVLLLIMSLFLMSGNFMRVASTPPAVESRIARVEVVDNKLSIELELRDEKNHLRTFHPRALSIAGESRALICGKIISLREKGNSQEILGKLPSGRTDITLSVTFECSRAGSDLTALEDLFLWHLNAKLTKVDFVEKPQQ